MPANDNKPHWSPIRLLAEVSTLFVLMSALWVIANVLADLFGVA